MKGIDIMNELGIHSCFHVSLNDMAEMICGGDRESMKLFVENFFMEEDPVMEMSCVKVYADKSDQSVYDADDMTVRAQIGRWLADFIPLLDYIYIDIEKVEFYV